MWEMPCKVLFLLFVLQTSWIFVVAVELDDNQVNCEPEHIHLSYGNTTADMVVIWETQKRCSSEVYYADGPWKLDLVAKGTVEDMTSCGGQNCSLKYVHRVVLRNLSPSSTVYYRPTSNGISAGSFYFYVPARDDGESLQFFITSQSTPVMAKSLMEAMDSHPHVLLLKKPQQLVCKTDANIFTEMENLATNLPILIGPDREGEDEDCTEDVFSIPGHGWPGKQDRKQWYSLDIGLVHVIVYSSKVFLETDPMHGKAMQAWLVEDLTKVNATRGQTPWVIAVGSDPMYCQGDGVQRLDLDCYRNDSRVRYGLEDIFHLFAVDMVFELQYGVYERTWPHYKNVVVSRSYDNPASPVEVILSGGVPDSPPEEIGNDTVKVVAADWSALRLHSGADSYGQVTVANASHLYFEWRSAEGTVLDKFWLVQDQHGNFSLATLPHDVGRRINQSIIAMGGKPGTYDFINSLTPEDSKGGEGWSKYSLWFGLCLVGAAIIIGLGTVTVRSYLKRRRGNAGRRWREVDCQGSGSGHFYSMASDTDSDGESDHDFEIDMFERSSSSKSESKLLTSY